MTEIKIGGRTVPLLYTTYEMIAIQEEIGCTAYQLQDQVFGIRRNDEDEDDVHFDVVNDPKRSKKLGTLIRILGNAGLEEKGEKPDLTDKWILRNIKPGMILPFSAMVLAEIIDGNKIETGKKEQGPVDEGLEEENAKKPQGN